MTLATTLCLGITTYLTSPILLTFSKWTVTMNQSECIFVYKVNVTHNKQDYRCRFGALSHHFNVQNRTRYFSYMYWKCNKDYLLKQ